MKRRILAFCQDEDGQWIADLECGHSRHFRHNPPWMNHDWVITSEGREAYLGREIDCTQCVMVDLTA